MKKACENALIIARYLEDHPKVKKCIYPGKLKLYIQLIINRFRKLSIIGNSEEVDERIRRYDNVLY